MVQGDVGEKHRVFNSRTDVDGQAIISIRHQVLIEQHAIIPPAIVQDQSFYRIVVERKIDCRQPAVSSCTCGRALKVR